MPGESIALAAERIVAAYGSHTILHEASICVRTGEIVALVGHNGAGKSTLLKCLFGLLPVSRGSIAIRGSEIRTPTPAEMLSLGVALAPQGNRVLPELTVEEHVRLAAVAVRDKTQRRRATEQALSEFAILKDRRNQLAGTLSGGEKQMLVIAASLVTTPEILLLDEPTLGLASSARRHVLERIVALRDERHLSLLVAEQRVQEIVAVSDRVCVMRRGVIAFDSGTDQVRRDPRALTAALF